MVWHHSLLLMNSFNKTEAAVFSCRLCFLRAFPFISLVSLVYPYKCSMSFLMFDCLSVKTYLLCKNIVFILYTAMTYDYIIALKIFQVNCFPRTSPNIPPTNVSLQPPYTYIPQMPLVT